MELDNPVLYTTYDPDDVGFGIENLPEQVRLAWQDTREIEMPKSYSSVQNIVVAGMGGSALGPLMMKQVFSDRLFLPVEIVRDYVLPAYIDKNSLVVLSSFSGNTEEVLTAFKQAEAARAKIVVITTGGRLGQLASDGLWPAYVFDPGELAKQPRYGVGFSFTGVIGLLERANLLKIKESELQSMIAAMAEVIDSCAADVPANENPAKQVAEALYGKNIFIIAAEHLIGNANVLNNQINENAKQLSHYLALPELNHHFLEGLTFPREVVSNSVVFLLRSSHYFDRTMERRVITADVFEAKGISVIDYVCEGQSKIDEAGEVLQFGSYVAWYLALLNHVVTTDIRTVEGFKEKLQASK